jgi:hypothetical protein
VEQLESPDCVDGHIPDYLDELKDVRAIAFKAGGS